MSYRDSQAAPSPAPVERELRLEPEGSQRAAVRLLNAGVHSLAAQVEALRQRTAGQPAAFFTQFAAWRAEWASFMQRNTQEPEQPMSAEDRARLRHYVEQYEAIRQGVLRALALPSDRPRPPQDRGGWPWWVWALLLGGGAGVAIYARRSRS